MKLLDHLCKAPWCSLYHKPNWKMLLKLTASHLPLIVGREYMREGRDKLLAMISSDSLTVGNVVS